MIGDVLVKVPITLTVTPSLVALEFVPAWLAFGEIAVGTASSPMTAILHNSGEGAAEGLDFSLDGNGFAVNAGACGTSLPSGGSCAVHVRFIPVAIEPAAATFSAHGGAGSISAPSSGSTRSRWKPARTASGRR